MLYNGEPARNASGKVIGHIFGIGDVTETPPQAEKAAVSEALEEEPMENKKPAKAPKKTAKK